MQLCDFAHAGLGSLNAFTNAGPRFDDLKSMFITHLHTDHIVDYFSFFISGGYTDSKGKAPGVMLLERDQRHGTSAVGRGNLTARSGVLTAAVHGRRQ